MQKLAYSMLLVLSLSPSLAHAEWWNLLKTTTDEIADIHFKASINQIATLMDKLYKKNPKEVFKSGFDQMQVKAIIFDNLEALNGHPTLNNTHSANSIYLAFHEDFTGDRVFALIYGMTSMLMQAYNGRSESYIIQDLDPQKFYILAKNLEIIDWKLAHDKKSSGALFFQSNYMDEKIRNLSFKRLIGKLISQQEIMSQLLQNSLGRSIKSMVINVTAGVLIAL